MERLMKLFNYFKKKPTKYIFFTGSNGIEMKLRVYEGNIVQIPWMSSTCPFRLENDGSMTLRLIWDGNIKARGYGKVVNKDFRWREVE